MLDHKRELTYPAVIDVLADGEWHADEDLREVTCFPHEWLKELEHERKLERRPGSPQLVRLAS